MPTKPPYFGLERLDDNELHQPLEHALILEYIKVVRVTNEISTAFGKCDHGVIFIHEKILSLFCDFVFREDSIFKDYGSSHTGAYVDEGFLLSWERDLQHDRIRIMREKSELYLQLTRDQHKKQLERLNGVMLPFTGTSPAIDEFHQQIVDLAIELNAKVWAHTGTFEAFVPKLGDEFDPEVHIADKQKQESSRHNARWILITTMPGIKYKYRDNAWRLCCLPKTMDDVTGDEQFPQSGKRKRQDAADPSTSLRTARHSSSSIEACFEITPQSQGKPHLIIKPLKGQRKWDTLTEIQRCPEHGLLVGQFVGLHVKDGPPRGVILQIRQPDGDLHVQILVALIWERNRIKKDAEELGGHLYKRFLNRLNSVWPETEKAFKFMVSTEFRIVTCNSVRDRKDALSVSIKENLCCDLVYHRPFETEKTNVCGISDMKDFFTESAPLYRSTFGESSSKK